jgi:hypothetical protein
MIISCELAHKLLKASMRSKEALPSTHPWLRNVIVGTRYVGACNGHVALVVLRDDFGTGLLANEVLPAKLVKALPRKGYASLERTTVDDVLALHWQGVDYPQPVPITSPTLGSLGTEYPTDHDWDLRTGKLSPCTEPGVPVYDLRPGQIWGLVIADNDDGHVKPADPVRVTQCFPRGTVLRGRLRQAGYSKFAAMWPHKVEPLTKVQGQ